MKESESVVGAHVFGCTSEEYARALYDLYKEAANTFKLNRWLSLSLHSILKMHLIITDYTV